MARQWTGMWAGGRTRPGRDGKTVWVLERMINAKRYSRTLEARNEKEAMAELALFERDPIGYATASEARAKALADAAYLNEATIEGFLAFLRGSQLDEDGRPKLDKDDNEIADPGHSPRTERYRKNTRSYLAQWADFYDGRDVREVKLPELKKALARWGTAKKSRIIALKTFMSFLREERALLDRREDPTLDLIVPSPRAEKGRRAQKGQRKWYEMNHVARLYRAISWWESPTRPVELETLQAVRDLMYLQAKFGMHASEVERLAQGHGRIRAVDEQGEISGTVTFLHKNGNSHTVSLDARGLAAAQRLRVRGAVPSDSYIRKVIRRAAKSIGVEPIKLGTLRHSFVTWSRNHGRVVKPSEGGVPLTIIANVLGHQSTRTTTVFYDGTEIPEMIVLDVLKLEHPDDPVPLRLQPANAGAKS
ncbi:MAG: tyrosine-type recombinase/integrase [Myxococcaceae bacterium]